MMSSLDYENEIQFQFQLEIVPSGQVGSQQIENAGPKREGLRDGRSFSRFATGAIPRERKSLITSTWQMSGDFRVRTSTFHL
jgi:hypothetical protein